MELWSWSWPRREKETGRKRWREEVKNGEARENGVLLRAESVILVGSGIRAEILRHAQSAGRRPY